MPPDLGPAPFIARCACGWESPQPTEMAAAHFAIVHTNATIEVDALQLIEHARNIVGAIDAFDAKCKDSESTDTGEAWELFWSIRDDMAKALGLPAKLHDE